MSDYMSFWWSKFLFELLFSGAVFLMVLVIGLIPIVKVAYKQRRCKHEAYRENRACHAICKHCGKDLGFIGNVHKMKK